MDVEQIRAENENEYENENDTSRGRGLRDAGWGQPLPITYPLLTTRTSDQFKRRLQVLAGEARVGGVLGVFFQRGARG